TLYRRGGGGGKYSFSAPLTSPASDPGPFTQAILTRKTDSVGATTGFTRELRDGSTEQFTLAQGTNFFMTSFADPQGNAVDLTFDAQMRLTTITDAIGQATTLAY